jgi:hypothetical protein
MISIRCSNENGSALLNLPDCSSIQTQSKAQRIKQKATISAFTLLGSLLAYYYAKSTGNDVVPSAMVGGYVGSLVGEFFASEKPNSLVQRNTASSDE